MRWFRFALTSSCLTIAVGIPASGQARYDPTAAIAAQKAAMLSLAAMDGVWRGPAWTILENGQKHNVIQTERIGPCPCAYECSVYVFVFWSRDGAWKEVGDRIMPGQEPVRFFEMNLKRVGNTDWPTGVPIPKQ